MNNDNVTSNKVQPGDGSNEDNQDGALELNDTDLDAPHDG